MQAVKADALTLISMLATLPGTGTGYVQWETATRFGTSLMGVGGRKGVQNTLCQTSLIYSGCLHLFLTEPCARIANVFRDSLIIMS